MVKAATLEGGNWVTPVWLRNYSQQSIDRVSFMVVEAGYDVDIQFSPPEQGTTAITWLVIKLRSRL